MSEIELQISVKEENALLFKRCVRKLLDATFIVGEKDEILYNFIARESNRQDIADYFRMIGYDVEVDTVVKVAMLRASEADAEAVGLKRSNILTFTTEQYHILLVLWEIYLSQVGYEEVTVVEKGDFIDKLKAYEVNADRRDLNGALKIFKKYTLIDYDEKDTSENALIRLYPSLQFGWDLNTFKVNTEEYIKESRSLQDDVFEEIDE